MGLSPKINYKVRDSDEAPIPPLVGSVE